MYRKKCKYPTYKTNLMTKRKDAELIFFLDCNY